MKITFRITEPPAPKKPAIAFGDAAHAIAHPVAKILDRFMKTDFSNCKSCAERRERWNKIELEIKKYLPCP